MILVSVIVYNKLMIITNYRNKEIIYRKKGVHARWTEPKKSI